MKLTAFNAKCPLEIGDRIITTPGGKEAQGKWRGI